MTGLELPDLPVRAAIPALLAALDQARRAVLVAPPGAGKTTLVPLALKAAGRLGGGRILLLEPRRLAARAAARRMAELLGEQVGATVGYVMRMDRRVSAETRILVVTEGVLSRMILDDPELSGVSAVVFDEFHERSLDGDFGLALALDVQAGLRPDLRLLVMSATLDGARVAALLGGAPVIESAGRVFPVALRYRERPPAMPIEEAMAAAIVAALAEEEGSLLAFLPGQREIERTAERLAGRLDPMVEVLPLHGQLDGRAQDAAIRPAVAGRRKVVLATAVAETSLTIDGVRVVIDSGLSRLPRFEPATGITRLETVRVSRASADQRAGRAGRTAPGVAIRLWRAEQTAALRPFTPPEILEADLAGLVLDCAAFGVGDPLSLAFLDPPPAPALAEARRLLVSLAALDPDGRLTVDGAAMRRLALPVRLAHMVAEGAKLGAAFQAAELAVLLTERGLGGDAVDLERRLARWRSENAPRAQAARQLARRLAAQAGSGEAAAQPSPDLGRLLIHAWPERVGKARGARGRFVLANGRGALLDETDPLAASDYLVIADLQGKAANARIMAAAATDIDAIRTALAPQIERLRTAGFDPDKQAIRLGERETLGAVVLGERWLPAPHGSEADEALLAAVRGEGLALLPWTGESQALRRRLGWLHRSLGPPWPDVSDQALLDHLEDWLGPFLSGSPRLADLPASALKDAMLALLAYPQRAELERLAPSHFDAPSGSRVPIRYEDDGPLLSVRVQELFGLATHPALAGGRVPLTVELLSPARRPIQTTRDLPGFWRGSWAEVRASMRGRYPKHPWPEDPLTAEPTARAKPRNK